MSYYFVCVFTIIEHSWHVSGASRPLSFVWNKFYQIYSASSTNCAEQQYQYLWLLGGWRNDGAIWWWWCTGWELEKSVRIVAIHERYGDSWCWRIDACSTRWRGTNQTITGMDQHEPHCERGRETWRLVREYWHAERLRHFNSVSGNCVAMKFNC